MIFYTIKDVKDFIKGKLDEAMQMLSAGERLPVNFPRYINEYKINHPKGELLVVYKEEKFGQSKVENGVLQDRDIKIGVIVIVRKTIDGMAPEEYVDWVTDTLSGLEMDSDRPDRFITAEMSEWLKEQNYEWWYGMTFKVPVVFMEKQYRNENQ